jgi:hypothetical protein
MSQSVKPQSTPYIRPGALGLRKFYHAPPEANPTLDCAVELAGEHLLYSISLKRTGVYLAAAPLDNDGVLETIVRLNNWATLQRLVGALERNATRSLHPRPLEVGYSPGFDNRIIR